MLLNKVWGPITWALLHTLVEKIKGEHFDNYKIRLFNLIKKICIFSNCAVCSKNSDIFFSKINPNQVNNINDFKNTLYIFHNFISYSFIFI